MKYGNSPSYLELTPRHLHCCLGVQPFIDCLEGSSPNLYVEFEISSIRGRCHRFGLHVLLLLLLGLGVKGDARPRLALLAVQVALRVRVGVLAPGSPDGIPGAGREGAGVGLLAARGRDGAGARAGDRGRTRGRVGCFLLLHSGLAQCRDVLRGPGQGFGEDAAV